MNDEKQPNISIVVPFYNTEKSIKNSVGSLLNQTVKGFEVIFVNDGSTDDTVSILERLLSDCPFGYKILNQSNMGVSAARNAGVNESSGTYICYLDADDFVEDNFIADLLPLLKNEPNVIVFGHDVVDEQHQLVRSNCLDGYSPIENGIDLLAACLSRKIILHTESVLFRKAFIIDNCISYNENLGFGEDQEFNMIALYKADKVRVLNKQLVSYVKHSNSVTAQKFNRTRYGYIEKYDKLISIMGTDSNLLNMVYDSKVAASAYICTTICQTFCLKEARLELKFLRDRYLTDISVERLGKLHKNIYVLIKYFPVCLYILIKSGRFRRIWFASIFNLKNT